MLVPTISFEIRDFTTGSAESFLVENNELNYALIASRRNTRDIKFGQTFDFQYDREMSYPQFMLFAETFVNAVVETCGELVRELDDIDQMV